MRRYVSGWFPFQEVNTTAEVLASTFPANVIGYLITALFWGLFEGFSYVVIRDKISMLSLSKCRSFDWGALICAVMCILPPAETAKAGIKKTAGIVPTAQKNKKK